VTGIRSNYISGYIYEYIPMLQYVGSRHSIVKIKINKQFILMEDDDDGDISVLGQYTTTLEAINAINEKLIKIPFIDRKFFVYAVVNLEHMIPSFLNGPLRDNTSDKPYRVFYSGTKFSKKIDDKTT